MSNLQTSNLSDPATGIPTAPSPSVSKAPPDADISHGSAVDKRLSELWDDFPGLIGWLSAVQNDAVGGRLIVGAFCFFLLGGLAALLMRLQLFFPQSELLGPEAYNQLFTVHGSVMMYLFAVPMLEGMAIMLLPFLIGNREMPFPRLGVFSMFTFIMGGILFFTSYLAGTVPDAGWFAYVPLSGPEYSTGIAIDYWLLALGVAEIGAIAAGVEIIIAITRMRAPGMSIARMPVFAWAYLVMAFALIFAFTTLFVASLMLELDRKFGTQFFNAAVGGDPLLWQHLFWIFGHPEVYIQFIPATGLVSMIIPVFSRQRLIGYAYVVMALVATGALSFALWAHHMYTVGMPQLSMAFFSAASILIAIPAGIQIFAWIATIAAGRPIWKTPFLFSLGFIVTFVLGGITGVMVGLIPFDWQVHDSYFIVAHFHYVLIGGVVFPIFAALYYWLPKFSGRMMDERLGQWNFWLMFIGFHVAFFPMHISGLLGMPRRFYTYLPGLGWDIFNQISTIGAFIFAAGVALFLYNLYYSMRKGEEAASNPWQADSLEWQAESPPVPHGFTLIPVVRSRHPLWDDKRDLSPTEAKWERLTEAIARWPLHWRGVITTSLTDGRPEELFRVSGPSIWPFITALGVITIFGSEIFSLRLLVVSGALLTVAGLVGWHWPNSIPITEEELDFEQEYGIEVRPNGSRAVARWGVGLLVLIEATVMATMIFSYLYLRARSDQWPPADTPLPDLLAPIVSLVAVCAGAAITWWARRAIVDGQRRAMQVRMLVAFVLGGVALALLLFHLTGLSFGRGDHAYGSMVFLIGGYLVLLVASALGQNLFIQYWAWRGHYSQREHIAVEVSVMYWIALAIFWVISALMLWVAPYVG